MPATSKTDLPPVRPDHHIGMELRAQRLAMSLSHEDVAAALKIQLAYIRAIETLDHEALPSVGYALGYVRAYAEHVGLSGKEAVSRYKHDSALPEDLGQRRLPLFIPKNKIRLPRGFVPALTVLGCAAVITFWYAGSAPVTAAPTPLSELLDEGSYAPQTLPEDPDILTLKAIAPSWVQVSDSTGRVIMSRIMVTDETWTANRGKNLLLSARDGGALQLYSGRELLGVFGEKGVALSGKPIAPSTLIPELEDIPLTEVIPQ